MAQLPPIRKFYLEDYASQKSWIGPLLLILNQFMNAVVTALNKQLTLVDNTTSDIRVVQLSSVPTFAAPTSVAWVKSNLPVAVLVGAVRPVGSSFSSFVISTAIQVQWQMSADNKSLQVVGLTGITPTTSSQYSLTLVCISG